MLAYTLSMLNNTSIETFTSDGLDRKSLNAIKSRFFSINERRLARTLSALHEKHRTFLKILPLLFHTNHPMMPGYVSSSTPAGIRGYKPTKEVLKEMQQHTKSFSFNRAEKNLNRILGIYIMGSCGTIAHADNSDLDIWICHSSELTHEQIDELQKKCQFLTQWAASLGLEAHFFLIDPVRFKLGEQASLSMESCGTAQRYLLLDEFYRTALHIAGCTPLWWYIPTNAEKDYGHYANLLLTKRFLKSPDIVDFGPVDNIPAGEFIGAGIWQLYKGIESPYKSVIKLILAEVYAAEYPTIQPLSLLYKNLVYQGESAIDEIDPYILVYRKIEHYLKKRAEIERLELVRRCLYFKINKPLSKQPNNANKSWQHLLLENLVQEWEWSKADIKNLDARHNWKTKQVAAEHKKLTHELNHGYRFMSNFAQERQVTALISSQEMTVLGRKLYAAFERRAGKIELINPGISKDLAEETLYFALTTDKENSKTQYWSLHSDVLEHDTPRNKTRIKRTRNLIELITWCYLNGLMNGSTRLQVVNGPHKVSKSDLLHITESFARIFQSPLKNPAHENFQRTAQDERITLFINIDAEPMAAMNKRGMHLISGQTDALAYGGMKQNLLQSIDKVTINSWHEVTTKRYEKDAILHCLMGYLLANPPHSIHKLPTLDIQCFSTSHTNVIVHRVEELFHDIFSCFYTDSKPISTRYIFAVRDKLCLVQFIDQKPHIEKFNTEKQMLTFLGKPQREYSPIVIDRYALRSSIIATLSNNMRQDTIQVYFKQHENQATVYVSDEKGSITHYSTPFVNQQSLLNPLKRFLQNMLYRQNIDLEKTGELSSRRAISCYEIIATHGKSSHRIERRRQLETNSSETFYNVQAIAEEDIDGDIFYSIYCNQKEYTELEYGRDIYCAVARQILKQRSTNETYPCYITDLDLSPIEFGHETTSIQTCIYLQHKAHVERTLNTALLKIAQNNA